MILNLLKKNGQTLPEVMTLMAMVSYQSVKGLKLSSIGKKKIQIQAVDQLSNIKYLSYALNYCHKIMTKLIVLITKAIMGYNHE